MAKEIVLPINQRDNPKEKIEIGIVHTDVQRDYAEFINSLANELGISNREAFYERMESLLNLNSKAVVDLDGFKKNFINMLSEYTATKKHNDVIPVESNSIENSVVHDSDGDTSYFNPEDIKKEENLVNIENPVNIKKEENLVNIENPVNIKKEEISVDINNLRINNKHNVVVPVESNSTENLVVDMLAIKAAQQVVERSKSTHVLELYLYNLIPYAVCDLVGLASSLDNFDNTRPITSYIAGGISMGMHAVNLFRKQKWYTPKEIATLAVGLNFYTLPYWRGVSVKNITLSSLAGSGVDFHVSDPMGYNVPYRRGVKGNLEFMKFIYKLQEYKTPRNSIEFRKIIKLPTGPLQTTKVKRKHQSTPGSELKKDNKIQIGDSSGKISGKYKDKDKKDCSVDDVLKDRTSKNQIGAVYVWPISKEAGNVFWIPFEFNPNITTSSRTARYQAMQVLSRMGDLQAYTGTDSLSVTLSTMYYPFAEKPEDFITYNGQHLHQEEWMTSFSLKDIQLIELAYRSLVLPYFSPTKGTATEAGYKYSRPPLLKIIIGDVESIRNHGNISTTENTPFSNILTYPKEMLPDHVLFSDQKTGNADRRYFRTFVAASVEVKKDIQNSPLYLNKKAEVPYLVDTFGFEITLNLIEVTPNYMDVLPSFGEYFNGFMENRSLFLGG